MQVKDGEYCNPLEVKKFLQYYIPEVTKKTEIITELSFKILTDNTMVLTIMLHNLEKNLDRFKLRSFGISVATMEEVFMAASGQKTIDDTLDLNFMNCGSYQQYSGIGMFCSRVKALCYKKFLYIMKSPLILLLQLALAIICAIVITQKGSPLKPLVPLNLTINTYHQATILLEEKTSGSWIHLPMNYRNIVAEAWSNIELIEFNDKYMNEFIIDKSRENGQNVRLHYMAGATLKNDLLTVWYNTEFLHSIPISVNLLMNALAQYFIGGGYSISVINKPLPFASEESSVRHGRVPNQRSEVVIFFAIIVGFFLILPIREQTTGTKMLQLISGVRGYLYWMGHLIWDISLSILFILIAALTLYVAGNPAYQRTESVNTFIILMICFSMASLALAYMLSTVSSEPSLGISYFVLLNIGGSLLYKTVAASSTIASESSSHFHAYDLLCILPPYALASALGKISQIDLGSNICLKLCQTFDCSDCFGEYF